MKKYILFIFCIWSFAASAQQGKDTIILKFSDNARNKEILGKLHTNTSQAKILVITEQDNSQRQKVIKIDTILFYPQILYKGFGITDKILPEVLKLKLPDSSIIDISTSNYDNKILFTITKNNNLSFPVNQQTGQQYSFNDVQRINGLLKTLDDYKKYQKKCLEYENTVKSFSPSNKSIEQLLDFSSFLDKADLLIYRANVYRTISDTTDRHIEKLISLRDSGKAVISNVLDSISNRLTKDALQNIKHDNKEKAILQLTKALEANPDNHKALITLAELMEQTSNYTEAQKLILKLYNSNLNDSLHKCKDSLGESLFEQYIAIAQNRLEHNEPWKALTWLKKAKSLCSVSYTLYCGSHYDSLMAQAVNSIYVPYFAEVARVMQAGKYPEAVSLLTFVANHSDFYYERIRDSINTIASALYTKLSVKVKQNIDSGNYHQAEKYISLLEELCSSLENECKDNYLPELQSMRKREIEKLKRYNDSLLNYGELQKVGQNIEKMKQLNEKYNLGYETLLDKEQDRYNKSLAILFYEKAKKTAEKGQCQKALVFLDSAEKYNPNLNVRNLRVHCIEYLTKKILKNSEVKKDICLTDSLLSYYGLFKTSTTVLLEQKTKNILGDSCYLLRKKTDKALEHILKLIDQKKYVEAEENLFNLKKTIENNTCCIHDFYMVKLEDSIHYPALYLKTVEKIYDLYRANEYDSALKSILYADKLYRKYNLSSYELDSLDVLNAIESLGNDFVIFSVEYFASKDDVESALTLLEYLRNQRTGARKTKEEQKFLGYRMALLDYTLNPSGNMRKDLRKKNLNRKWYRFTIRSYIRQRKKMKSFYAGF